VTIDGDATAVDAVVLTDVSTAATGFVVSTPE
jgi:hypothetical protein